MYIVYWIKEKNHTDCSTQGYIGITKNLKERLRAHKKNKKENPFTSAKNKYGFDNLIVEVLADNLTITQALSIEKSLRPRQRIGWNCQVGGELGVESSWYDIEENSNKHSKATAEATKLAIANKDTKEARAERARITWLVNKDSYKDIVKGSKNPRAILNEENVIEIKYSLIPLGKTNKEIAELFNVKPYVISFIRSGKNWSHI
jgi:predicted GIY-YIG superfamily endonuclease